MVRTCLRLLVPLIAGTLLPLAAPAGVASATGELHVTSSIQPIGAAAQTAQELAERPAAAPASTALPQAEDLLIAPEVTGPAADVYPLTEGASAVAPPAQTPASEVGAAQTVTYPDPPRTMTAQECREGLGSDRLQFIKSRFASCSGASFVQTWTQNGRVVGHSQYSVMAVATVERHSRRIDFQWHFVDMLTTGTTNTAALMITPVTSIPQVWPASAEIRQGGNVPTATSFARWTTLRTFQHTITVDPGQGTGPSDVVFAVYEPTIRMTFPTGVSGAREGDLFILPPRWDTASYLSNSGGGGDPSRAGAASLSYTGYLDYSTADGAPEQAVARHIEQAFNNPEDTYPPNPDKHIPGSTLSEPLNRINSNLLRYRRNRNIAVSHCREYFGDDYSQGNTYQCDEFPFASTYQGCAEPRYTENGYDESIPADNCSAMPVPTAENGAGGTMLLQFYNKNRVIYGSDDGFIVRIS